MSARRLRSVPPAALAVLAALCLLAARQAGAATVTLTTTRNLDFGRFVAATGGTVTVSPNGARTRAGAVILLNSPSAAQASFHVGTQGFGNKAVIITVPSNGSTRLSSGASSMPVNAFVTAPATIFSIPGGGVTLNVGAALTVAPNQPRGVYGGSFPLIVNYQ